MPYRSDMIQKIKIFFVTRSACAHFLRLQMSFSQFLRLFSIFCLWRTLRKVRLLKLFCGFTYRNYFGRKRAYKFNQLEILKVGNVFYFTKNGKKVVRIERIVTNADYLQSAYFNAKKLKI